MCSFAVHVGALEILHLYIPTVANLFTCSIQGIGRFGMVLEPALHEQSLVMMIVMLLAPLDNYTHLILGLLLD